MEGCYNVTQYGGGWGRQNSEIRNSIGTDIDLSTELGTSLSRSTATPAPKVKRLSFARHPSVVDSSSDSYPIIGKMTKSKLPEEISMDFRTLAQKSGNNSLTIKVDQTIDIQGILDGSTRKPRSFSDFKKFLQQPLQSDLEESQRLWIKFGTTLLDFLLEFRAYVEKFSKLPLMEQSLSPHPFELLCVMNAKILSVVPHGSLVASQANDEDLSPPVKLNKLQYADENTTVDSLPTPARLNVRKVNWAPSVRSNSDSLKQQDLKPTTPVGLQEFSFRKAEKGAPKSCLSACSTAISETPSGINPSAQSLRPEFDRLTEKYLGSYSQRSTNSESLLSGFSEISRDLIDRALYEARYTNHPAVLAKLVEEILQGLNNNALPQFLFYVEEHKGKNTNFKPRTFWGLLLLLFSLIMHTLMIIVPSPLTAALNMEKEVPSYYRLMLFPTLFSGSLLIMGDRLKIHCIKHWRRSSEICTGCKKQDSDTASAENGPEERTTMRINLTFGIRNFLQKPKKENERLHKTVSWVASSIALSFLIQTIFLVLPFIR
ncbi:hypothetical protein BY996DRAFT_4577384 [Phakopsora pachyrhizi]|nr:hypothetical protein BY996DRAFT_4577384 [Phakopsora pachyrhizi]